MLENYQQLAPREGNFVALSPLSFLKRTADIFGERAAVIYGQRRYRWREVYRRSIRLTSALASWGICKGDTVSVLAPSTPELVECHFGIPQAPQPSRTDVMGKVEFSATRREQKPGVEPEVATSPTGVMGGFPVWADGVRLGAILNPDEGRRGRDGWASGSR